MQAEACFEAYLKRSKHCDLLVSNIQIQGETETLGEIDYIIRNLNSQKITHIELACKFYLYDIDAGVNQESKWIGPNRKDSLYDKLEKIKWRQFPIIHKDETLQTLKNLNIEFPTTQELCLKAFLFIPKEMNFQEFPISYQECIVGHWMRPNDFENEDKAAQYAIPDKKEWLLPLGQIERWHSFAEAQSIVLEQVDSHNSPLLYKKTQHTIERFFVVWW